MVTGCFGVLEVQRCSPLQDDTRASKGADGQLALLSQVRGAGDGMSYSEHAKMGYVYPWQCNKEEEKSLFHRKVWAKSSLKENCASVESVVSSTEEHVRQSRNVPTVSHLPSEHTSRETH